MRKLQRWKHFEQRVKLFVSSTEEERYLCGAPLLSTFDPRRDNVRLVQGNLTATQLEAAGESRAPTNVKTVCLSVGSK